MEYVIGLLAGALALLALAFKLQANKLNDAAKKVKEQGFRLEVIEAQEYIKTLEKKAHESNELADSLLSKYESSDERKPIWNPYDKD
jgi:hypothetical protein